MGTNEGLEIESRREMKSGFSAQYAERADCSGDGWKGNFRLTTKGTGSGLRETMVILASSLREYSLKWVAPAY